MPSSGPKASPASLQRSAPRLQRSFTSTTLDSSKPSPGAAHVAERTRVELSARKCSPILPDTVKLDFETRQQYHLSLDKAWVLADRASKLKRRWLAKDFNHAIACVNIIGLMAQKEGHFPDLHITNTMEVTVEYSTPHLKALTENDFISAAKVDRLMETQLKPSIAAHLPPLSSTPPTVK